MEFSIVNFSAVTAQADIRFDADYYKPKYLEEEKQVKSHQVVFIGDVAFITDGQHGYHEVDEKSPILHLTAKNAKNWFADSENADRIAKWVDDKNKRSSLVENDLILSTRGTVGYCAIVKSNVLPANIDQDVARIAIEKNFLLPEYLLSFLNCQYGQDWIQRNSTGMVQQGLSLQKVRQTPVPLLSIEFQDGIKAVVDNSLHCRNLSKCLFKSAEESLLLELGLTNWQPKHHLSFVKNYSDTEQAGRIDAEYFQPKYEEIEQAIKQYSGGCSTIGKEFRQNKSTFKIDNKKTYQYVEIGSVDVSNGDITPNEVIGEELPANAKRILKKNDVIVSKVRTYRGAITIVEESGYVGSGAFTVLSEKGRINKETLLAFLRSKPLLAWSLKPNTGTSYPVIIDDDILSLPIPLISKSNQLEIQQKVSEAFKLRKQSKHLLECAKRAVELAIEQDEQAAMDWLEKETGALLRQE
ncbi:MAG: restriction endonuclease subunit S [Candidatus Electrothrix sp. EH2]|nr:restriction endonuclease subunit S [Candidatus Electrothrix sp. EH2]